VTACHAAATLASLAHDADLPWLPAQPIRLNPRSSPTAAAVPSDTTLCEVLQSRWNFSSREVLSRGWAAMRTLGSVPRLSKPILLGAVVIVALVLLVWRYVRVHCAGCLPVGLCAPPPPFNHVPTSKAGMCCADRCTPGSTSSCSSFACRVCRVQLAVRCQGVQANEGWLCHRELSILTWSGVGQVVARRQHVCRSHWSPLGATQRTTPCGGNDVGNNRGERGDGVCKGGAPW
jgi:hypothetical protein